MGINLLKDRTRSFAVKTIAFVEALPRTRTAITIGGQLLRSASSVGCNYRAACRARSLADFIAKMGIVEEECDESLYWMDLLVATRQVGTGAVEELLTEGDQILSIVVASIKTARSRKSGAARSE